jgi:hypothetical protein
MSRDWMAYAASLLAPFRESLVMSIELYLDETGTHDETGRHHGAEVAGVAGWLATREGWARFYAEWQAALDAFHVPVFHFSELNQHHRKDDPTWTYYGWDQPRFDNFVFELIRIARDNSIVGVGGFVATAEFNELVAPVLSREIRHPYYAAFPLCLRKLREALAEFNVPPEEDVLVFMEEQNEFKKLTDELYDDFRRSYDLQHQSFPDIVRRSKTKYLPLQAADLLAFRGRKVNTRLIQGKEGISLGSWDGSLGAKDSIRVAYHDRGTLIGLRDGIVAAINARGGASASDAAVSQQHPSEPS